MQRLTLTTGLEPKIRLHPFVIEAFTILSQILVVTIVEEVQSPYVVVFRMIPDSYSLAGTNSEIDRFSYGQYLSTPIL